MGTILQSFNLIALGAMLLASACSARHDPELLFGSTYPFVVAFIEANDSLAVHVPVAWAGATIGAADNLFVVVQVKQFDGWLTFRQPLRPATTDTLHAGFHVPGNAVIVNVSVAPNGVYMNTMSPVVRVPIVRDGIPVRGSIPEMITVAASYEEALRRFSIDERYHPDDYMRWVRLLEGRLRGGEDPESALRQADSLVESVRRLPARNARQLSQVLLARAQSYALVKQWQPVSESVRELVPLVRSNPEVFDVECGNVITIITQGIHPFPPGSGPTCSDSVCLQAYRDLARAAWHANSLAAIRAVLAPISGDSAFVCAIGDVIRPLITRAAQLAGDSTAVRRNLYTNTDFMSICARCGIALGMYAEAVEILERAEGQWDAIRDWTGTSLDEPASDSPSGPLRLSGRMYAATAIARAGDSRRAAEICAAAIGRFTKWRAPRSYGAYLASQFFLRSGALDSADKYTIVAKDLESPYHDLLRAQVDSAFRAAGTPVRAEHVSRAKFGVVAGAATRAPSIVLASEARQINPGQTGDTTLLLMFTTSNCGPCAAATVDIINGLKAAAERSVLPVLLVARNDPLARIPLNNGILVYQNKELLDAYDVEGFPVVIAVRNGVIVRRWDDLPPRAVKDVLTFSGVK